MSKTVWDGMSKKRHKQISQYIGKMIATLGLSHWNIKLADEFCEEDGNPDALATCQILPGRHYAVIRLAKDFNEHPYEEKKQAIIHELVHCHQQRLLLWADDTLREALGTVAYEIFWAAYRDNFEHMVDDLSVVFARLIDDSSAKHLLGEKKK
jgi:hypothetical protein